MRANNLPKYVFICFGVILKRCFLCRQSGRCPRHGLANSRRVVERERTDPAGEAQVGWRILFLWRWQVVAGGARYGSDDLETWACS